MVQAHVPRKKVKKRPGNCQKLDVLFLSSLRTGTHCTHACRLLPVSSFFWLFVWVDRSHQTPSTLVYCSESAESSDLCSGFVSLELLLIAGVYHHPLLSSTRCVTHVRLTLVFNFSACWVIILVFPRSTKLGRQDLEWCTWQSPYVYFGF